VMGISVKCRSRYDGTENSSVNLPPDGFEKAKRACAAFGCVPYYAVLVDGAERIRCFLLPLAHLLSLVGDDPDKMHYWQMSQTALHSYHSDPSIKQFELQTVACSWRDAAVSRLTGGRAAV
jgi:hypothetical protein